VSLGDVMVRALDLRLSGRGFHPRPSAFTYNNLGQVVRTHVSLPRSSIMWYQSMGGDALRLGR